MTAAVALIEVLRKERTQHQRNVMFGNLDQVSKKKALNRIRAITAVLNPTGVTCHHVAITCGPMGNTLKPLK